MTHRQPAAFGSPVFSHPCPVCFPVLAVARQISGLCRAPPDLRPLPRPARSPATAAPRQISGHREACPPARRPRRELRSARRLEARPGPAGLAVASNRAETAHLLSRHVHIYRASATKFAQYAHNTRKSAIFHERSQRGHRVYNGVHGAHLYAE